MFDKITEVLETCKDTSLIVVRFESDDFRVKKIIFIDDGHHYGSWSRELENTLAEYHARAPWKWKHARNLVGCRCPTPYTGRHHKLRWVEYIYEVEYWCADLLCYAITIIVEQTDLQTFLYIEVSLPSIIYKVYINDLGIIMLSFWHISTHDVQNIFEKLLVSKKLKSIIWCSALGVASARAGSI